MARPLLAIVLVAGCAHTPDLALRPESPAPPGVEVGTFAAGDGTALWRRTWKATAPQQGVLIIQHGLRDHSDNYDRLARKAAAAGFTVWAMDLRGHARSAGPRVAPRPWHQYVDDMDQFIGIVRAAEPGQPIFVMGHSMGGAIAALEVIEKQPAQVAGLILSAPVLNVGVSPFAVAGVRLMGVIAPSAGVMNLDPAAFSTDPAIAKAIVADPLVEQGAGPARTASGLTAATADIFDGMDRLTIPVLALHGTSDQLTAPSGSRELVRRAASTDKTLRIYEGFAHDLVHEPEGEQVEDDIVNWLRAHTGGPAVAAPPVYTGDLGGDPAGRLVALSLGGGVALGRVESPQLDSGAWNIDLHLGRGARVGWGGGLHVLGIGGRLFGSILPVGGTVRFGGGAFTLATGIGRLPGWHPVVPVAAWLELPLGPVHATLGAELDYRITGRGYAPSLFKSDLGQFSLTLRAPGDRRYWPGAFAGAGPYVQATVVDAQTGLVTVTAGIALYGAD